MHVGGSGWAGGLPTDWLPGRLGEIPHKFAERQFRQRPSGMAARVDLQWGRVARQGMPAATVWSGRLHSAFSATAYLQQLWHALNMMYPAQVTATRRACIMGCLH